MAAFSVPIVISKMYLNYRNLTLEPMIFLFNFSGGAAFGAGIYMEQFLWKVKGMTRFERHANTGILMLVDAWTKGCGSGVKVIAPANLELFLLVF